VRNIYSPEVTVAKELMVDQVATALGQDPYQFRRSFVRDSRMLAVLDAVAKAANWGKRMAPSLPRASAFTTSTKATPRAWPRSIAPRKR
jgi:isoquinoline 1-oxidoreductase beta subunit